MRNLPPYIESKKKSVFAMIRQLGLPCWFISLSAADTHWNDLLITLGKLVDKKDYSNEVESLDWATKSHLVLSDPVICVRYFDYRVSQFMNIILKSPFHQLGELHDFFLRVKFQ